jgi:hypothetical protein
MGDVTPLARSAEIAYEKIARGPIEASATRRRLTTLANP